MSYILCIETAAEICSVALITENDMVMYKEVNEENAHSRYLTVLIDQIFKESGITARDLSAIAISKGPGSYTGLRIGASVAKGLCYAVQIPLIAIDTLEIIARGIEPGNIHEGEIILPMLDARRMEVYCAAFDSSYNKTREDEPFILDENSFSDYLATTRVHFAGNGAAKFETICKHPNAVFHSGKYYLTAKHMAVPTRKAFNSEDFTDHVYFEPTYLKPVMATKPKKKWF